MVNLARAIPGKLRKFFLEALPSPLSSRAKPRDLQFCGPFLEMFFDKAAPEIWVSAVKGPAVHSNSTQLNRKPPLLFIGSAAEGGSCFMKVPALVSPQNSGRRVNDSVLYQVKDQGLHRGTKSQPTPRVNSRTLTTTAMRVSRLVTNSLGPEGASPPTCQLDVYI